MTAKKNNQTRLPIFLLLLITSLISANCQNKTIAQLGAILNGSSAATVPGVNAPSTPVLGASSDTGISSTDGITSLSTGLIFSGTATDGDSVELYVDGIASGMMAIATGGDWLITHTGIIAEGTHIITAKATDATGNVSADSAGLNLTVDSTVPAITSITSTSNNGVYGTGNSVNITVNFSEPVTLSGGNIVLTLNNTKTVTIAALSNLAAASGTYTVVSGTAELINPLNVNTAALSAGALTDAAGNNSILSIPPLQNLANNNNIIIGNIPTILSITSATPNGDYSIGTPIDITVTFSTNVTLSGGNLNLILNSGGLPPAYVTITPFTGQSVVSGTYTVGANENSSHLNVVSAALSAGTLYDILTGANASLVMPVGNNLADNKNIAIDTTVPSGYSVAIDQAAINNANKTALSFTFNNAEVGTIYNYTISSSGGGANVYSSGTITSLTQQIGSINVTGLNDGTLTLSVTLTDVAGTGSAVTSLIVKDTVDPTVTITSAAIINNANKTGYTVGGTCSENGRLVSVNVGGIIATPVCATLNYMTAAMDVSALADSPAISVRANHNDTVGNTAIQAVTTVLKDTINPTVTISSAAIINIANKSSYSVNGACSENGQTVTVNVGGVIATPTCAALAYTTAAMDISAVADNTALSITANHSDAAGNVSIQASTTVLKDTAQPGISSITSTTASGTYGSGNNVNITVNFSEPTTLAGGNLIITLNNTKTAIIAPFSNATTATGIYTVVSGLSEAVNPLDVNNISLSAGTLTDTAGNTGVLTLPMAFNRLQDNKTIVIGDIPDIVSISSVTANGNYKAGQTIDVTVTFSTNVTLTGGNLNLVLDTGAIVSVPPFTSQSAASGTYTVASSENSAHLNVVSASLTAGTLQDSISFVNVGLGMPASNLANNKAIVIDTTNPSGYSVAIDQTIINNSNKTAVSFTLGNAEVGATYNYSISSSGGGTNVTGSGAVGSISQQVSGINVSGLGDGTLTLSVTLTDSAGNTGSAVTSIKLKDTANPTVTITSAITINNANKTNYTVSGACSENGQIVTINVGGVMAAPTCTTLLYSTAAMDVSAVADNAALSITANHSDAAGNSATQASATTVKDTVNPTVTISSAAIINNANKSSYSVSGACSENGQIVTVNVGGVIATPTCTTLVYTASAMNISGVADNAAVSISANHIDAAGNSATQASTTVLKDTAQPVISSITSTTASGTYGTGNSVNITVNFSKPVTLAGGNLIVTLNNTRTVTIAPFSNSSIAAGTYTIVSGLSETINPLDVSSNLSITGGTLTDVAGNIASLTLPMSPNRLQDNKIIAIGDIPSIFSISSSTANAPYKAGQAINVTVTFTTNVTLIGGTLDLTLDTGAIVSILPFTGQSVVSGSYTIATAENSADLNVTGAALSAGTLRDSITFTNASLGLPAGNNLADNKAIVIDTVSPVISSTIPNSGAFKNNANVSYTLSEVIASGTITWTGTSGPDNGVVHAQSLSGTELPMGAHSNITLNSPPALISGSVYSISFDAMDLAGNAATTVTKTNVTYDTTAPIFSSVAPASSASVDNVKVSYTLSETLASGTITWTGVAGADNGVVHAQTLSGGDLNSGAHANWLIANAPILVDGSTYTISFNGVDAAGNTATAVTITGILYDTTAPSNQDIVFALAASKIGSASVTVVSSGTAGNTIWFASSGLSNVSQFTADATHTTAAGTAVSILAPAIAGSYKMYIIDAAGNVSAESIAVLTVDNTPPTVTVNQAAGQTDPVAVLPISFTVIFSEAINPATFTGSDITQNGTATGVTWAAPTTSDNITWTIQATAVTTQGTIIPSIVAAAVQDVAGNNNAASTSTDNSVTFTQALTVTINQAAGQADPINTLPVTFTVVFSSAITPATFTSADIIQTGTATGVTWSAPTTSDNITWTVQATGSSQGTLAPTLAANVVQDSALRNNDPSTSTDNSVTYELVKPSVTINQSGGQVDPTNTNPVSFTIVFTEAINASTFTLGDFTKGGTATYTLGNLSTSDNITYTVDATVTVDGTVIPSIGAGVLTDLAGNTNNASTSTDNTVTFDSIAPVATISGAPTGINNVNALDVTIAGAGVVTYQYAIGNAITCPSATYGSDIAAGTHITDNISAIADGSLSLCVRGKDAAGNLQIAASATSASWTKDSTAVAAIINGAPSGTNNLTTLAANPVTISGTGVTEYKYAIISNASSNCAGATYTGGGAPNGGILVATAITANFSGLADGGVTLCVIGYKPITWQVAAAASVATWTKQSTAPTVVSAESLDMDGNGKIDHMRVTFSGNVDDTTFPGYSANGLGTATVDWIAGTYTNRKLRQGTAVSTFSGGVYTDIANDNIIYIAFDENAGVCNATSQAGCDTGIVPDLTTTATPGLKDTIGTGNPISQIATATITEIDSAKPAVVGANPYSNTSLNVYFSESVTAATAECGAGSSQAGIVCATIYSINGSLTVSKAYMGGGIGVPGNSVVLTTSAQVVSQAYTATAIAGVIKDVNNLTVYSPKNTANFTGAPATTNLLSAVPINNTTVELTFNVDVTSGTTDCASYAACDNGTGVKYHIPGLQISAAVRQATTTKVRLTTSSHLSNTVNGYQVTVASGVIAAVTGGLTCNSPNNTANFTGDTLPEVQSVATLTATQADVIFSEYVLMDTSASGALNLANYTISPALGTLTVAQLSNTKVRLTSTSSQTPTTLYTVTVNNVTDITTPAGNVISATAKTGTFIGQENLKILSAVKVADVSTAFDAFSVTFSKPLIFGGGTNAVDNMANWTFPSGMGTVTLCTPSDDAVCSPNNTINYVTGSDTVIYFKASPPPTGGAYTVVGASSGNCIKPSTDPGCLQGNPNDRASVDFNLPLTISSGPVYTDPFNDAVTLSGQVLVYNGKLLIGPNNTDSGLFETNINMANATSITLDSDNAATGFQPFRGNATTNLPPLSGIFEDCAAGNCSTGNNYLAGTDYMYSACYKSASPFVDSTLTGNACVAAGGTEYLFVLGYITTATTTGYQSNWNTTNKVSPFIFTHVTGLSNAASRTFRAMSAAVYKGWVYQASQHQAGSMAVRWNRFTPDGVTKVDLAGNFLNRIGEGGTINNGQQPAANGLISIDTMYEHDNDGAGTNYSQLYIANGGSCTGTCISAGTRTAATFSDGGVLRSTQTYSNTTPPIACGAANTCPTVWEDVTPSAAKWRSFMSIPLPDNAAAGGDWSQLIPINTITPAIKGVPKMTTFNGDLFMIRNACSNIAVKTVAAGNFVSNGRKTCTAGAEVPQLWRLPKFTGVCTKPLTGTIAVTNNSATVTGSGTSFTTQVAVGDAITTAGGQRKIVTAIASITSLTTTDNWSPAIAGGTAATAIKPYTDSISCAGAGFTWAAGSNGGNIAPHWKLVAEYAATGKTIMAGANWSGGSNQTTQTLANTEITLLVANGNRLYVGFDNASYGVNLWRTRDITQFANYGTLGANAYPTVESDFEAVCATGNACTDPVKEFGLGSGSGVSRIFDGITANDAGTDYLVINGGDGINPLKIFRNSNN